VGIAGGELAPARTAQTVNTTSSFLPTYSQKKYNVFPHTTAFSYKNRINFTAFSAHFTPLFTAFSVFRALICSYRDAG
jgi:hypothetical protein